MSNTSSTKRWNWLTDFVRLVMWSAFVENGRPQSVVLISDPGHGKTELLDRFRPNGFIEFFSDITFQQLMPVLRRSSEDMTKYLGITEFQKVIMRRRSVSANFLALMMQAMEEGVGKVAYGPVEKDFGGARLGLIAATTVRSLEKHPDIVTELGLDSRSFFVDARASIEEVRDLERRIANGDMSLLKPVAMKVPEKRVFVECPKRLGQRMRIHWMEEMRKARGARVYGVRTMARFMHTSKGVALSHGRDHVKPCDLDELYRYRDAWLKPPPMPSGE
jgi:hypothetical protein